MPSGRLNILEHDAAATAMAAMQVASPVIRQPKEVIPAPSAVEEGVCILHPSHHPPQVLNNIPKVAGVGIREGGHCT